MKFSAAKGTCVIGQLTNFSAFASVEQDGRVWVKSYPTMAAAIYEANRSGLVDKLFAAAAVLYLKGRNRHCVTPILSEVDHSKLAELGFEQPRAEMHM